MAKKREFKEVANGLLGSFVSRNNDVYGYWGIGKLFSHMLSSRSMILKIDLINKTIEPKNVEFEIMISIFYKKMIAQINHRDININQIKSAKIILKGYSNDPVIYLGQLAPHRMNCIIEIKDDLNRIFSKEINVRCREHNPETELKSVRTYKELD